ncbi:major facilitator superfamily protein [Paenibacillus mucilaginosus 3016]|uniref:Major facilitator superfamily protein n=1 Tax=Paenibacillus mucilaginosus 3016 TaxID=1116391 RepID=H6NI86_9BACL|nr:MFS transporter [Paenibacillus mucilaginosus]AFC31489.1 major facilitator superfamily protein [Paenibacillus mucilaginosus 3016]WFA20033.1 MFS transporter [Paenibacillus mucilaginosus]
MLKHALVRTILFSRILLQLGVWIRNFAILLYVTDVTNNDPLFISLISVAEFAPIFLFSIIGGTFADRWPSKRTMIGCDLLSALSMFAVLGGLVYGSWHVLLFATLVSSIMSQFSQPSAMKLFKQHIPADGLQGVMAMFQSTMAVFMVIGPVLGAFIYQQYGIVPSLVLAGICFVGSGLILFGLPRDPASGGRVTQGNFMTELRDGLRYVGRRPALRTLGWTFGLSGLAVGLTQPLMLFLAVENLGQDKSFLQWLLMANGAAMLVGGGVVVTLAKKLPPQLLLAAGLIVSAAGVLGLGWSRSMGLTLSLEALNGFLLPCIHIGINTLILKHTEQAFIGRVGGVLTPLFMGSMVIGMSSAGFLKEFLSLGGVFSVSALLFALGGLTMVPMLREKRAAAAAGGEV